jgi:hypothetical protein
MPYLVGVRNKEEVTQIDELVAVYSAIPLTTEIGNSSYGLLKQFAKSHGLRVFDSLIAATVIEEDLTLVHLVIRLAHRWTAQSLRRKVATSGKKMAAIILNSEQREWLQREHNTWRLIRAGFADYLLAKKPTADKLHALCMLTWITTGADNTRKVTLPALRSLTGKAIADCDFANLSGNLAKAGIAPSIVRATKNQTGFVNFYNAYRNSCLDWFRPRTKDVYDLFDQAYALGNDGDAKATYAEIANLDGVGGGRGNLPAENLLTPVIACLDPRKRCPVINGRDEVRRKLEANGVEKSSLQDQFWAFVKLIHQGGITDAFMLDIASVEQLKNIANSTQTKKINPKLLANETQLAQKDENEVEVLKEASGSSYVQRHNWMTNRLRSCCESSGKVVYAGSGKECCFDARVENYDGEGRDLLIEAKSSTEAAFCRMAVGQLLDYQRQLRGSATTDLAVLFPDAPGEHVRNFLGHIGIKALWFIGDQVVDASGSSLF